MMDHSRDKNTREMDISSSKCVLNPSERSHREEFHSEEMPPSPSALRSEPKREIDLDEERRDSVQVSSSSSAAFLLSELSPSSIPSSEELSPPPLPSTCCRRKRIHGEQLASPFKMWRRSPAGLGALYLSLIVASFLLPRSVISSNPTDETTSEVGTDDGTEFLTTSSSVTPVKLQTITLTSPSGGDMGGTGSSVYTSTTAAEERSTPMMNQLAAKLDKMGLWKERIVDENGEGSSSSMESVNTNMPGTVVSSSSSEDAGTDKGKYEYKSAFPHIMKNETREALQEEGSNHQPVVFVGGQGYVPPNSLRARPPLEAAASDPLWQTRPVESRYPVPNHVYPWDRNSRNPFNITRVQHIEAECQDDFMKIRVAFNGTFHGLIYSSGYSYDPDCVYINGTGRGEYEYLIKLNRCGTLGASNHVEGRKEPSKNFMWNTVTVQYNPMIEEEWDEHFKVTCEYGYDFWKTVTFPFLDVEVATGNPVVFTLTPPECYMEVRYGFGTSGTRVGGPVRVGDPLTLMIYMRSQYDGFDIVVNDCYAHNGATKRIQLIDHYGCPVDSKLMSPFRGTWNQATGVYETQVFAYLKTFRFTGSPALYIECDVRMCHGQCPSQPCYWRNVKSVRKRSADEYAIESEKNSTQSENISLFQALRVLQEDEETTEAARTDIVNHESVCVKTGVFTAMIGLSTLILVILTLSTMVMCFRLRRVKSFSDPLDASEILKPYSHHASPHRHGHWSSPSSSISK